METVELFQVIVGCIMSIIFSGISYRSASESLSLATCLGWLFGIIIWGRLI